MPKFSPRLPSSPLLSDGQVLSGSRPAPGLGVPFEGAAGERLEGDRGRPPRVRYESLCWEDGPHSTANGGVASVRERRTRRRGDHGDELV